MADFSAGFAVIWRNESAELLDDRATGEFSRYGITLKTAASMGFCASKAYDYIRNLTEQDAKAFYLRAFWKPLLLDVVRDQAKANKIFDMAVNMGIGEAIRITQCALNDLHSTLAVDGKIGPRTLACINGADTFELLTELRANSLAFYHKLVDRDPAKYGKYWAGWKARAEQ